jgi:integrase/recombinase XerD
MPITFNLELDSKPNRKGEHLIMIRCSKDGDHKRINSGQHLAKRHWDCKKQLAKKSYPNHVELNKTLIHKQQEIEEVYLKLSRTGTIEASLIDVVKQFGKPKSINFFDFAINYKLSQFKANNKLGTYRRYESILNKIKNYAGKDLTLNSIDYTFLKGYESHCLSVLRNSRDTASSNLSAIRSIIKEGIRHQFYKGQNPFELLSLSYTDNTKLKLSVEELTKLKTCNLPVSRSTNLARDFFMACYYVAGCRGGDMVEMTWNNVIEDKIIYTQRKTGKQMIIPVCEELRIILNKYKINSKYIFGLLRDGEEVNEIIISSRLTYVNKYLKEVCKYAGIFKKITTHCARHTFADISLDKNDNDIYTLKEAMGHSSIKTTEGYLRNRNNSRVNKFIKSTMDTKNSD